MKTICLTTLSIILILSFGVMSAQADTAIAFDDVGVTDVKGDYSLGWQFNVNQPITVTSLGLFDYGLTTMGAGYGLLASENYYVGIYNNNSAHTLLVQGIVLSTSPDTELFRYVDVTPTLLPVGTDYRIAAFTQSAYYTWEPVGISWQSEITFVQDRFTSGVSGLVYPQVTEGFNGDDELYGDFGPNFKYSLAVPEPGILVLLALSMLSVFGLRLKWKP